MEGGQCGEGIAQEMEKDGVWGRKGNGGNVGRGLPPGKGREGKESGEGKLKKGRTRDQSRIFWKVFDGRSKSGEIEQIAMSRR